MNTEQRWAFISEMDEEFLEGGVTLSEWCSFIVREADMAFEAGANLASIVTAVAGIETYLRSEYTEKQRLSFYELIEKSQIDVSLKRNIHMLRKYRNQWVHVSDPHEDQDILDNPEKYENQLEDWAKKAVRVLRQTIYSNPWV